MTSDGTLFAYTEQLHAQSAKASVLDPGGNYPAYINLKRMENGQYFISVRTRGRFGMEHGCMILDKGSLEQLKLALDAELGAT